MHPSQFRSNFLQKTQTSSKNGAQRWAMLSPRFQELSTYSTGSTTRLVVPPAFIRLIRQLQLEQGSLLKKLPSMRQHYWKESQRRFRSWPTIAPTPYGFAIRSITAQLRMH